MFNKNDLNKLYQYALSLSRHEDIAYDLLQSALEKYLKKSPESIENPMAYLKTIIRNLFFDLERHNKIIPMVSTESDELDRIEAFDATSMDDVLIDEHDVQRLTEKLSSEENELLYLWAVEEYTTKEIAEIFNQPKGTILSKLHRLKKRIKRHAQDDYMAVG
jgi:RNA polymerase sigma-70 factor (ECF subfamily)